MDPFFEAELALAPKGSRESRRTLYRELKAAILDGRLRPGTKLPATRKADAFFGVSRNTVVEVYERLLTEGYVVSRHGSGTYVADTTHAATTRSAQHVDPPDHRLNTFWLRPDVTAAMGFWRDAPDQLPPPARTASSPIDFRPALIDARLFPLDVFRRISARQLRGLEKRPARHKSAQGNQGHYFLRDAITKHIALTRAVVCQPDDVVVTSGAQQAFDLLARVLVTPNETVVAVEDPGYPPMRVAFAAAGAKVVAVEVDAEGLVVERLPPDVAVICVCPSHQYPLGMTMSVRRRAALVAFARERGAVVIEDDYDGEFRYDGSPVRALRSGDADANVFYVGTFSKCMLPALRLGFIVAPEWAMSALVTAKNCLDWHCSTPLQLGVSVFIAEGHLARHVRKMRHVYQKRRQRVLHHLRELAGEWLEPIPSVYGMHVTATVRDALDLERVAERLGQHDVHVHTLRRYYLGPETRAGLVFGYGAVDLPEITRGLTLLCKTLRTQAALTENPVAG